MSAYACPRCGLMSMLNGKCGAGRCGYTSWATAFLDCDWDDCDKDDTDETHYGHFLHAKRLARGLFLAMCGTCHNYMQGKRNKHAPCDICSPSRDALRDVPQKWLYSDQCLLNCIQGSDERAFAGDHCVDRDCCCDCHPR